MAERIKGITIEFNADTSGLKKAMTELTRNAKKTNTALRDVNKALKLNPTSVTLLTQKQTLLRRRVEEVTDKLKVMKLQYAQMKNDPSVDKKSAEFQKLQRDIKRAEAYQKQFRREMLLFGNAKFNAVGTGLQNVGRKLTNVTRRARQAAGAIAGIALYKGFQRLKTLDDVSTELEKLGYTGKKLEQIMNDATESVSGTKYALTDMSKVAKGALGAGVEEAYDLGEYLQRVADISAVAGEDVDKMGALMNKALSKGIVDAKLLNQLNANGVPIYKLLADSMGVTTEELMKMVRAGEVGFDDLYKATSKYKGLAQELGTETLSGAVTVLGQQFGLMGAEFLDGAYEPIKSGVKGIVKYLKELRASGAIKEWGAAVGETIKYFVQYFKEGETSIDGFSEKAQNFITVLSPLVTTVGAIVQAFMNLPTPIKQLVVAFGLIGGPLLTLVGGITKVVGIVINAVNVIRTMATAFAAVKTAVLALSGPIGWIVIGIGAAIAAGIALYKNWDKVKAAAKSLLSSIKTTFAKVKEAIVKPFQDAWNKLKDIVSKIKNIFPLNIGKIFSGLKLPHITVSGGKAPWGILGKGTPPKFSVKWYKKAMESPYMFSSPTVFGAGEAGDEILYGRKALLEDIASVSGNIDYELLAKTIVTALQSVNSDVNLIIDGQKLAKVQAPYTNAAVNQLQARQARQLGLIGV